VAFQRVAESPAGADGLAYLAKLARGREDVRVLQTDRPVDWRSHEVVTDGKVTGYADRITETELAAEHPGRVLATVVDALPTPTEPEAAAVGDDEIDERLARLDSVAATAARPQEEQPRPSM